MSEVYPRDMVGYGRTPPFADWPGGARVALQFVINYEEGGENNILHGDAASEAFLSEIIGAAPWPGQRHMNMELIYEYGTRAGFWRLHRLFTERDMPVTVFAVATAMARNPQAVAAMNEAGWEIATHGYKWIDYRDTPEDVETRHIADAIAHPHEGRRRATARLLPGALVDQHHPARLRGRRLPLLRRCVRRRSALLDRGAEGPAIDRALHARLQRHALRRRARLQFGRSVLHLSQGLFRHALRRRRDRAEDAVDRPAQPPRWAARPRRLAGALSRLCRQPRKGVGRDAARHRPPLDRQASAAGRLEAVAPDPHAVRRALRRRLRAFAVDRRSRLRRGPWRGSRQRRRARQGDGARRRQGQRGAEARAHRRASRPRRQAGARQGADRRIVARAEGRRPRPADARRARALQRRQRRLSRRASASRSSWR